MNAIPNLCPPLNPIFLITANDPHADAIDFLREEVEKYCYEGEYHPYLDYNDRIEPDTIAEQFEKWLNYSDNCETFEYYLSYYIWDVYDFDRDLVTAIFDDMVELDEETREYIDDNSIMDLLIEAGYKGINVDVGDLVPELHLNLLLATAKELNYDLSSISDAYVDPQTDNCEYADFMDNALTYLIEQQGYDPAEVVGDWTKSEFVTTNSKFVNSILSELNNAYSGDCHCLTMCVHGSGTDVLNMLDTMGKAVKANARRLNGLTTAFQDKLVTVTKNAEIGLFAPFNGAGSVLEIKLDKNFIFPLSMLYDVQIEGRNTYGGYHGNYTVDSVYGLVGECWRATATITAKEE